MSDALDVLFETGGSTEPDPGFRQDLMARVRAALDDPALPVVATAPADEPDDPSYLDVPPPTPGQRRHPSRWVPTLVAAVAASVLAGVLAVALVRGGTDEQQPSGPAPDPSPTSVAVTPSTVADWVCPNPERNYVNHCRGALDPGTYETWAFQPSFSFTVPEGWSNLEDKSGSYLLLPPGADWNGYVAGTSDSLAVYSSVAAPAGCKEYPDPSVATTVAAYVGWLGQQPSLVVGEPTPVEVGGLTGTQVDVALSAGPACSDPEIAEAYAPVFIGTNASRVRQRVVPDERLRLQLFDRPDGTLMVIVVTDVPNSTSPADGWTAAAGITDTFRFGS